MSRQRDESVERIKNWKDDPESYPEDAIYSYLEGETTWSWPDVPKTMRSIYSMMFPDDQIEEESPLDWVLHGAAAAGRDTFIRHMACMLGVSKRGLELAVADWFEWEDLNQKPMPSPVTMVEFSKLLSDAEARLEESKRRPEKLPQPLKEKAINDARKACPSLTLPQAEALYEAGRLQCNE